MALAFVVFNLSRGNITARTLRRVTDNLQGFVYRCRNDRSWAVTFMSEGGEALTGYPAVDFLSGKRHFGELVHPEDQEWVWLAVQEAVNRRERYSLQYRMVDRKGDVHWCQDEGHGVFDTRGELRYLEGLVRNDDARHKAQSELQQERDFVKSLVDTAPVIILLLDADGRVRYVNPFFEALTGYKAAEVQGKDWFTTFLPQHEQARIRTLFTNSMDNQPVRGNVNAILTRTGEERVIEWNDMLLQEVGAHQSSLLAIGMDVTQRRELESRLLELNQSLEERVQQRTAELEHANKAKSEFLSRMSHELRTPLNVILGFSQLLQDPNAHSDPHQSADYANEIYKSGQHLLELVNEVLDLARIESGKLELELEPMSVAPEIEQCAEQIALCAQKRSIDIQVIDGHCFTVLADPLRFRQVVLNLLSNAVKYNREGGRVVLECSEPSSGWMRLSVSDTGRGMSAEQQARLFRPFERFVSPYEGIDGTGIGLSLCKYLVEAMQGRIGVCSTEGEGTTLWFELPLQAPGALKSAQNSVPAETGTPKNNLPTSNTEGHYRLLCIEDNPSNLLLIQRAVKTRSDWDLHCAVTAEAGLHLAEQVRPDLILLDINLPDMSGYDALAMLRRHRILHSVPVIAVTANAMPSDIERGRAAGFSDYITKPFKVGELFAAIEALLPAPGGKP